MTSAIKKRSGQTEEFSQSKLERSLRQAGASESIAREVASNLSIREGISTSELRSQVLSKLRTKDARTAEHYEQTRCCRASSSSEMAKEFVRLHPESLKHLGLRSGATLRVGHGSKAHTLRAEESSSTSMGEIQLHPEVLRSFETSSEAKFSLRRA